ncbi:ABC transporter permease subunit [Brevibacillus fluminis]|uniref:Glutathione transport system permease protein GsiC n=1 Tax=Brevibacillus fluminis TaxID=511487 RepID=A0A3M8DK08_9BACL|nr:nickel ABC transporter permease [Brevibacillus fluminis]RNB87725.1 ABC transporter permease subunit [Brevibacillus fluminis]
MIRYMVKRITGMIPMLFIVSVIIFLFIHVIPGDPARIALGADATGEAVANLRTSMGLDQPLFQQYVTYIKNLLRGDFGNSFKSHEPVSKILWEKFLLTLELTLWGMGWSLIVGILMGVIAAVRRNRWPDYVGMSISIVGLSMPEFWFGFLLIDLFSIKLGWLPTGGTEGWGSLIMPSLTLGIGVLGLFARFTRTSLLEVMKEDYIRTAKAKGVSKQLVILKHALRNALIPLVTMSGIQFGFMLSGAVVIEVVFSWPGMGVLLVDAVKFRDFPVIQGSMFLFTLEFLVITLIVDLLYALLNPQMRID